jgi:clan AA aspartic protease (TIGR02281 family)
MYANGEGVTQNYVEAMKWQRKDADPAQIAEAQKTGGRVEGEANPNFPMLQAGAQTLPRPNSSPQGGLAAPSVPMTPGAPITSKRREPTSHGNASFVTRDLLSSMRRMKMAGFVSSDEVILKVEEVAIEKLVGDAEGGNAEAQNELGYAYWNGLVALPDRPRDDAEALRCRGAEAQQSGCAALQRARNVTAMGWWRKAADQGYTIAQYNLGTMYEHGEGVPKDYAEAAIWYRKAADQGDADAKKNLATLYDRFPRAQWPKPVAAAATLQRGVPLKRESGIFVVPVQINDTMTLDFVIDSGAADVSVPADVVSTLMRAGTIKETDFIGQQTYVLADGTESKSVTFTIRSLRVGDRVLKNVKGSVASSQGSLLLGQSFLERFKSWSIDNTKHELVLEPR